MSTVKKEKTGVLRFRCSPKALLKASRLLSCKVFRIARFLAFGEDLAVVEVGDDESLARAVIEGASVLQAGMSADIDIRGVIEATKGLSSSESVEIAGTGQGLHVIGDTREVVIANVPYRFRWYDPPGEQTLFCVVPAQALFTAIGSVLRCADDTTDKYSTSCVHLDADEDLKDRIEVVATNSKHLGRVTVPAEVHTLPAVTGSRRSLLLSRTVARILVGCKVTDPDEAASVSFSTTPTQTGVCIQSVSVETPRISAHASAIRFIPAPWRYIYRWPWRSAGKIVAGELFSKIRRLRGIALIRVHRGEITLQVGEAKNKRSPDIGDVIEAARQAPACVLSKGTEPAKRGGKSKPVELLLNLDYLRVAGDLFGESDVLELHYDVSETDRKVRAAWLTSGSKYYVIATIR